MTHMPDDIAALERMAPHDIQAEQAVLGACLLSQIAAREVTDTLAPADYYRPGHGLIHQVIADMLAAGQPVDARTLADRLSTDGHIHRVGGADYIAQLLHAVPTAANADWYADIVRGHALRRALVEVGTRIASMGYSPDGGDASDLAEQAVTLTREVRDRGRATEDLPVLDIHDFLAVEDTYDWLIEGLLERGDRLILTASEGGGKSTLLRQMAVCGAAGVNPFRPWEYVDPCRVLVLDCENGAAASRRKFRPLLDSAAAVGRPLPRDRFFIECRPEGLDLTRPADRAWAMRRVEKIKPDLLIIGPVYRLHAGNPNDEELARKVSAVIDEARATARCAVLMEAHAPHHNGFGQHRNLRPAGSSLWLRWPEFGYGLRPVEDEKSADLDRARVVVPWRGARDERKWPRYIKQGEKWPWVSYTPIDADTVTGHSPTGATH